MSTGELVVADYGNDRLIAFQLSNDLRRAIAITELGGFDRPYGGLRRPRGRGLRDRTGGRRHQPPGPSGQDAANPRRRFSSPPTELCLDNDDSIVIADSGAEQLYRLIDEGPHAVAMGLIAGCGATGSRDGSAADAELAQPAGVARTEVGLVFCDAASSNIRLLTDSGKVATITGNGFFDWGLVDGPAHKAMLQRPDLVDRPGRRLDRDRRHRQQPPAATHGTTHPNPRIGRTQPTRWHLPNQRWSARGGRHRQQPAGRGRRRSADGLATPTRGGPGSRRTRRSARTIIAIAGDRWYNNELAPLGQRLGDACRRCVSSSSNSASRSPMSVLSPEDQRPDAPPRRPPSRAGTPTPR